MNNKGILGVKLLTIIIVSGIVLFLVIPKTINYFSEKRKESYIKTALHIKEVKNNINSLKYKQTPLENEALLVKLSDMGLKKSSPYGMFKNDYSYVIVLNCGEYYDYYFASIDTSGHGIPIIHEKELKNDAVVKDEGLLSKINNANMIENLYVANTLYKRSDKSKEDDKNILLIPVSGDLAVPHEFKTDVHKIYSNIIKNIDTNVYNKEVLVNGGEIKYDNQVISYGYKKDLNGLFRYIAFPNNDNNEYFSSFVVSNNSYTAGVINKSGQYSSKNIIFDSVPTIVINETVEAVIENNKKYLMWNLMTLLPNNDNYTITECGAIIVKNTVGKEINLTFDTPSVLIGKSNNNCEFGNIFAIRKDKVKTKDKYSARGYIKYTDRSGVEYISYSKDVVLGIVE